MKITFLNGTAIAVTVNDALYLFDAGESVFSELLRAELDPTSLKAVFISGRDYRRIAGLSQLISIFSWTKAYDGSGVSWLVPTNNIKDAVSAYVVGYREAPKGDLRVFSDGEVFSGDGFSVSARRTPSGDFLFTVDADGRRILILNGEITEIPTQGANK